MKSVGEDEVVSDTGSSIIQEMHWHVEQLQLIQHKRFTLDSPVSLKLSNYRAKNMKETYGYLDWVLLVYPILKSYE